MGQEQTWPGFQLGFSHQVWQYDLNYDCLRDTNDTALAIRASGAPPPTVH